MVSKPGVGLPPDLPGAALACRLQLLLPKKDTLSRGDSKSLCASVKLSNVSMFKVLTVNVEHLLQG
jgi:hypothetical protein